MRELLSSQQLPKGPLNAPCKGGRGHNTISIAFIMAIQSGVWHYGEIGSYFPPNPLLQRLSLHGNNSQSLSLHFTAPEEGESASDAGSFTSSRVLQCARFPSLLMK